MPPAPPPRPPVGKAAKPVLKPVPDTAPATPAGNKPAPPSVKRPAASTSQAKDGLGGALETVSSFTETIAGFGSTLGNSLSKAASRHKGSHAATDKDVRAATATAPETAGGAPLMNPKTIGVAAVILVIAGAGLMMLGGDEDPMPPAGPATETAVATESPAQTEAAGADARLAAASRSPAGPVAGTAPRARTGNETQSLMEEARAALAAGDLYSPAGRNAVEFLVAARDAAPGDAAIAAELDSVVDDVFGRAEAALLDNRTTEASRALRVIGIADPDNPRLKFLNAQFDRQRMATTLDKARLAIRESRFEDAGRLLAQTETFAGADTTELDALSNELARARNAQQLDEVLALASERLDDNRLVSPSNDNARYFFELARTIDPDSSAARQGLVAVAGKLVLRARTAIDGGDLDAADALLTDARALDADSQELAAADAALVAARSPDTAVPNVRPVATAETPASDTSTRSTTTETPSEQNTASPPSTASQAAAEAQAEPRAGASTPQEITSIASVKRTKYVAPNYPRSAQRRDITGYVDVAFTVTETGSVADVEVREADPADVFEDAAIKAVEQWKFEPPVDDGIAVSKRVAVRMSFNLQ
jgi:TonB family protein